MEKRPRSPVAKELEARSTVTAAQNTPTTTDNTQSSATTAASADQKNGNVATETKPDSPGAIAQNATFPDLKVNSQIVPKVEPKVDSPKPTRAGSKVGSPSKVEKKSESPVLQQTGSPLVGRKKFGSTSSTPKSASPVTSTEPASPTINKVKTPSPASDLNESLAATKRQDSPSLKPAETPATDSKCESPKLTTDLPAHPDETTAPIPTTGEGNERKSLAQDTVETRWRRAAVGATANKEPEAVQPAAVTKETESVGSTADSTAASAVAKETRVAILGAGVSGLTAIKSCLEEGLRPVCYEQFEHYGGTWFFTRQRLPNQGPCVYRHMMSATSGHMSAFSDLPFPSNTTPFFNSHDYMGYLDSYVKQFDLERHINYNHKVTRVEKVEGHDEKWRIKFDANNNDKTIREEEIFEKVIVATGYNRKAMIPEFVGVDTFKGIWMHTISYRDPGIFREKNVLIVGTEETTGDIVSDAARYAKTVHWSIGKGIRVIPRVWAGNKIVDELPTKESNFDFPRNVKVIDTEQDTEDYLNLVSDHDALGLNPNHESLGNLPHTYIDDINTLVNCGKVVIHEGVTSVGPNTVVFSGGTIVSGIDVLFFDTGYKQDFSMIQSSVIGDTHSLNMDMYKLVWPMNNTHNNMAFLGCADFQFASMPAIETQSRWAAAVFSGRCLLPSNADMTKTASGQLTNGGTKVVICWQRVHCSEGCVQVNALQYQHAIAEELGVAPAVRSVTDPSLAWAVWQGPFYPYMLRLRGPHSWAGARDLLIERTNNIRKASVGRRRNKKKTDDTKDMNDVVIRSLKYGALITGAYLIYRSKFHRLFVDS